MKLHWKDLGTPRADKAHGKLVEIAGWPTTLLPTTASDHFLLTCEPSCCVGCVPANPLAGTLVVQRDDPDGWRYQLKGARLVGVTRRRLLAASPLVCLPMPALAQPM